MARQDYSGDDVEPIVASAGRGEGIVTVRTGHEASRASPVGSHDDQARLNLLGNRQDKVGGSAVFQSIFHANILVGGAHFMERSLCSCVILVGVLPSQDLILA